MRKRKIQLIPTNELRINKDMFICWNCMFWNHSNGICPFDNHSEHNYNDYCFDSRLFRYNLNYKKHRNDL